ncbi:positive regulation of ERK1 and ERK2 cascade via TNFSF11-mediated signaling [Branchiostoma belcheri]|nr:positive regulation of ERK1 and ERK2 cascade via TNFSF11-mediated signaling [Branchiostoma belcheri]
MSSRGEVLRMGQKESYRITTVFLILLHVVRGEICTENQYRPFALPWCCTSKCGPGTRIARPCDEDDEDSTECEPCGEGLYNPGRDQDRCTPKDQCNGPNEEVKTHGTDRTDNVCRCKVGSYREWEVCRHGPVCNPGTGATRNGICETCPDGTFSNETSRTQLCMAWTICWKLGFVQKEAGTNISDVICISRLPHSTRPWEKYSTVDNLAEHQATTVDFAPNVLLSSTVLGRPSTAEIATLPVAVWVGLGSVVVLAVSVSVVIGGICACKKKYDRPGTGVRDEENAFTEKHFNGNALPDQTWIGLEKQNTEEETQPLRPGVGDEVDMRPTEPCSPPAVPDDGFSTGDDSGSDTLSALSDMTPATSETDIKTSLGQEFNNPAAMAVTEDMITYLEQHLGRKYLALARKLNFKDGTTGLPKTDIDSLKTCQIIDGMHEAIRKTVETWKTRNGDWANFQGLLSGLHEAGMDHMVKHLCKEYNVNAATIVDDDGDC